MNLPSTSQKRLLLIWAFAIGWFYLGSLINFHQHHIWGKSLIPQINTCTRNKGKSFAVGKNGETAGFHFPLLNSSFDAEPVHCICIQNPPVIVINIRMGFTDPFFPVNEASASSQLRGPPQV